MSKISAAIVAHNEEEKIEECLQSLDFVDEIVVILDKCSDNTKKIVKKYTNNITEGSWNIEGERRNIALKSCNNEWILEIDADERISKELASEIKEKIANSKPAIFDVKVDNYIGQRLVRHGWLRTMGVLNRQTLFYKGLKKYHEDKEIHPTFDLNGEIFSLENPLIHKMDDNISDLLSRFNRNTSWRAQDLINSNKAKKNSCFFKELLSIKTRIFKSFFVKKGYKEGALGLLIALLCGLYPTVSRLKANDYK